MKRRIAVLLLCTVLLCVFSGCSLGNSEYISVEPHKQQGSTADKTVLDVTNSTELYNAVIDLVESGAQKGILSVPSFGGGSLHFFVEQAIKQAKQEDPLCAYAVESITYEIGTRAGEEAVALCDGGGECGARLRFASDCRQWCAAGGYEQAAKDLVRVV